MTGSIGRHRHVSSLARYSRRRSLLGVTVGVGLLVVVNAVVREPSGGLAGGHFVGPPALPVVQMLKPGDWRCPGPLPVGAGAESSRISIVNSGPSAVNLLLVVSRTGLPKRGVSAGASISRERFKVDRYSQAVVPLTTRGQPGFAAVSVETDAGGIGVGESVSGSSGGVPVLLSSPCSLVAGAQGYVPTGSTYGGSDVRLSLYDPDATPAVVNVNVSSGATMTSPPAFQGIIVPATGLVVLDLHRWVFEASALALTATAVSGVVVVGALELTSETVQAASRSAAGHGLVHVRVLGSSLLVGPERGLSNWAFTALQSRKGVASTFSVYNPGEKPVLVSVAPPGPAGVADALTEEVPAGGTVDFATPVKAKSGLETGSVVISAKGGMPVVVARLTTRYRTRAREDIDATPGTAGPGEEWLLTGLSLTSVAGAVATIEVPGSRPATVRLLELTNGAASPTELEQVDLNADSQLTLNLGSLLKNVPSFAVRLSANVPILVEEQLTPRGGLTAACGGIPVLG